MARQPRTTRETRTEKEIEMLENYDMDYADPLSIPPEVIKDGYVYHWARKDVKGANDYRVETLSSRKWTPVPRARANKSYVDPLGRAASDHSFIEHKDTILMERPAIYSQRDTERHNQITDNKLKSLRGVADDHGTFDRPSNSIDSF